jgi:hypothetical protein
VFENRVLRKIFGSKRDDVIGEWRKLHNEELNDLDSLPNIIREIKSRIMRWAGHVARMGGMRTGFWWGDLREKPVRRPRCRWRMVLKLVFKR